MYKFLPILVLLATSLAQNNDGDLESIIKQLQQQANNAANNNGQTVNKNSGPTAAPQASTLAPTVVNTNGEDLESIFKRLHQHENNSNGNNNKATIENESINNKANVDNDNSGPVNKNGPTEAPEVTASEPSVDTDGDDKSCLTADNLAGECVPYYLCGTNDTIINDGAGIIDIRVKDGECASYLDTCCLPPDRKSPDEPITPAPPVKPREGCGWRNPDGLGFRITGAVDNEANFGEFPWMVAILKIEPVNENEPNGQKLNVYVGGGSLIHPSVVLTAAHYVSGGNQLRVRAGEWDTQTKNELYPYQDRDVKEVVVHKDFNKGNLFYDIALLFLASPVDSAPNVGLACLPSPGVRAVSGVRCMASGWGKDHFGKEGRYQVILKRVEQPVVDRARCQEELRKTRLGKHFVLHSSFMCAGGELGNDTCKGDGGSPLVCPSEFDKDRYIQHGIVAWGIGCGDRTPAVYVDVGHLRSWVDDKVRGHGYDEKMYTYLD